MKAARIARAQRMENSPPTAAVARHGTGTFEEAGTGAPAPERGTRRLDRVLRAVDSGPRPFYRAAIVSLAVTSALALAISSLVRPARLPGSQREMIYGSLAALCLSAVLGIASLARRGRPWPAARLDRIAGPRVRAALWLALAVWLPFLLLVVYYKAKATFPVTVQWLYYGFEDKRWMVAAYLLSALAPCSC